jgi:predicted glycoside hydrolase/deacetylase ChbG (UPF0249 family)
MKNLIILLLISFLYWTSTFAQVNKKNQEIRLLVRGDDIGFAHAVNVGCIESYKYGIMRSVELMVPTPWFMEAVQMLNENPGLDVGIHLTLTSEWSNLRWRPLTPAKSIVDSNGYFFPMVWPNDNLPPGTSIHDSDWDIDEIEKELRAQIELALKHLPHISHLTDHMAFTSLDSSLEQLVYKLAKEYHLDANYYYDAIERFPGWEQGQTLQQRIDYFIFNLEELQPGTYIFIDHPAKDTAEMRAVHHKGYENVAEDREWVTRVFTNSRVKKTIREKNIRLISYKDLRNK